VTNPPASCKIAIPAATSHSQHPPSHQISKEPIATYARSSVADPSDRTPCTIPPLPERLPSSAAMLTKLSIFRCKLLSGASRLSLPHSQENTQPLGAFSGIGGMGFRTSGSRCVSFMKAPRPAHEEKNCLRKGALMTPIRGLLLCMNAMETQNMGKRWM
jgi:hypothetical protein